MRAELYLARRYLFRGKAKHISFLGIISCLGVILGVATVIVAISIVNGIDGGLMERIMRFKDHIIVQSSKEELLSEVQKETIRWPEIKEASLLLETQVLAKFEDVIVPLVVRGIDLNKERQEGSFYSYVINDTGKDGFFVGEGLKRRFYLDEEIEFYPLQKKLALKKETIRGNFQVGLYDIDNNVLITDLEKAKSLSPHCHFFLGLKLKEPFKAGQVKKKIADKFSRDIFASTWIETNEALFATLKLEKIAMFIILILIILIASFNIFATLTVKVVEKTKDIGILRSLGFSGRKVLSVFSLQGLILGCIGVLGGSSLGLMVCYVLEKYPFIRLPEEIFFSEYLPVTVDYRDIIWIGALAIFISFISSLLPAHRASRLNISEALRYE